MIVFIIFVIETMIGVMFWALFSVASDADKQQEEPVYEDGKKHSGLLEED